MNDIALPPATGSAAEREAFEHLVRQAEGELREHPQLYQQKLRRMAMLGSVAIWVALLLTLAALGGSVWLLTAGPWALLVLLKTKLIFLLPAVFYVLLRSLWIPMGKPQGRVLKAREVPALFTELARLRQQLDLPRIHLVLLTPELNAGISQRRLFGLFGPTRNTLTLGLPLLLALSPAEARAVLAHESGHLSGNHGAAAARIYQLRQRWSQIREALLEQRHFATAPLRWFFDWYAPRFAAYSFSLARSHEFQADAAAAELTDPRTLAQALVRTEVDAGPQNERFWGGLTQQVARQAEVPRDIYHQLRRHLREPDDSDQRQHRLRERLALATDLADTHPSLGDRLAALGQDASLPQLPEQSAAEVWLGDALEGLLQEFNRDWLEEYAEQWSSDHLEQSRQQTQLDALRARPIDQLAAMEVWQLGVLTEQLDAGADPLPIFQHYQQREPGDRDGLYMIGRLLLMREDPAGLEWLKQVIGSRTLTMPACELAVDYLRRHQQDDRWWLRQGDDHLDKEQMAQAERAAKITRDDLQAPEIDPTAREQLGTALRAFPKLKSAWLVARRVVHFPENPQWIILCDTRGLLVNEEKLLNQLVEQVPVPAETYFLLARHQGFLFKRRFKRLGVRLF